MSGEDPKPTSAAAPIESKPAVPLKDVNDAYAIKVKSDYVLSERPSCLAPPTIIAAASDGNNDRNNSSNNGSNKNNKSKRSKNNRGQNKKRPRDTKISDGDKACLAVVRGEPCPFQKSDRGCRYNHDLKEMLANRPNDLCDGEGGAVWLKGGCPFWNAKGYCQFGIMCRLGASHVNMSTGQNLCKTIDADGKETMVEGTPETTTTAKVKEESMAEGTPKTTTTVKVESMAEGTPKTTTTVQEESDDKKPVVENEKEGKIGPGPGAVLKHHSEIKNVLSKDTQISLRKNKYPFVCKRHYEKNGGKGGGGGGGGKTDNKQPPAVISTNTPALELKERKLIDFRNKVYIAPLTTVGNLPFRRIMKHYGADITCGEMALADQLLSGKPSEWALLKRHPCEDVFGVQIAAGHADQWTRISEVLTNETNMEIDFVDMNLGCPIDLVCEKGAGASMMLREKKLRSSLEGMLKVLKCPVTIKMRTGWNDNVPIAHELQPKIQSWQVEGVGAMMLHGRSRLQRYSRLANWDYIGKVACSQSPNLPQIPLIGNGDIFSYTDYEDKILKQVEQEAEEGQKNSLLPCAMLGRGALIKPWLPTEIKEKRHWDISATERLDMMKDYVKFGLEHWGSDQQGVNHTRRFLLEWMSFLHRYVPVGLLEVVPQQLNHRPPNNMCGRSDLETLMLSKNCADWIKISEMLLGPVPEGFLFEPKHKANSYTKVQ